MMPMRGLRERSSPVALAVIGAAVPLAALIGLLPAPAAHAQIVRTADATVRGMRMEDFPRLVRLAENVYAYEDLNGDLNGNLAFTTNSFIVVTSEGVLVADGQGSEAKTKRMVEEIAKLTPQPIRYMVVCADHGDHIAGNASLPAGATLIAHPVSKARIDDQAARNPRVRVARETVADRRVLTMGGTEIQILFLGRAHTGGDLHVYLPKENILFMSEAFFNRLYPSVGGSRSAFPIEWIETIRKAEAMNPAQVIPGHGFVDSTPVLKEELVNFRRALENLVSETRKAHAAGTPVENAARTVNLGEFQYWYRAANNLPDAVRQVYLEIEGKLK
jgi:glyoxylase-like metal-dependent hydrolase (beta-lactamase superfamily II)